MNRIIVLCLGGLLFLTGCAGGKVVEKVTNHKARQSIDTTVVEAGISGQTYTSSIVTTVFVDPNTGYLREEVHGNSSYSEPLGQGLTKVVAGAVVGGIIPATIMGRAIRQTGSKCISNCAPVANAGAQANSNSLSNTDVSIK
jgi:hypothetical protein